MKQALVWILGHGFGSLQHFVQRVQRIFEYIFVNWDKVPKNSHLLTKINCFFRNNCRGVISDNFPRFNQFKHVIPSGAFCRQRFCQFARRNWILGRIRYGIISRSFQRDHLHNQPVDFNYSCCQQHNFCPGHSWIPGEIIRGIAQFGERIYGY